MINLRNENYIELLSHPEGRNYCLKQKSDRLALWNRQLIKPYKINTFMMESKQITAPKREFEQL